MEKPILLCDQNGNVIDIPLPAETIQKIQNHFLNDTSMIEIRIASRKIRTRFEVLFDFNDDRASFLIEDIFKFENHSPERKKIITILEEFRNNLNMWFDGYSHVIRMYLLTQFKNEDISALENEFKKMKFIVNTMHYCNSTQPQVYYPKPILLNENYSFDFVKFMTNTDNFCEHCYRSKYDFYTEFNDMDGDFIKSFDRTVDLTPVPALTIAASYYFLATEEDKDNARRFYYKYCAYPVYIKVKKNGYIKLSEDKAEYFRGKIPDHISNEWNLPKLYKDGHLNVQFPSMILTYWIFLEPDFCKYVQQNQLQITAEKFSPYILNIKMNKN